MFASEVEANDFYKKVSKRGKYLRGEFRSSYGVSDIRLIPIWSFVAAAKPAEKAAAAKSPEKKKRSRFNNLFKIDKSAISAPVRRQARHIEDKKSGTDLAFWPAP